MWLLRGLICLSFLAAIASGQTPVRVSNAGFDTAEVVGSWFVPVDWRMSVADTNSYAFECDTVDKYSGYGSCRVRVIEDSPSKCCHIDHNLPPTLMGHKIRVEAWVKGSYSLANKAQVVVQVLRWGHPTLVQWGMVSGVWYTEWTKVSGEVDVATGGDRVVLTFYLQPSKPLGTTIWADDFVVEDLTTGVRYHLDPANGRITRDRQHAAAVYTVNGRLVRAPAEFTTGRLGHDLLSQQTYVVEAASRSFVLPTTRGQTFTAP